MRLAIKFIKDNLKGELVGAEIGVNKGYHAKEIYDALNLKMLYLIDPWNNFMDMDSKEIIGEAHFLLAKETLKDCNNIQFIRATSLVAATQFSREFDFIYIDGAHNYEAVATDILHWFPKVKKGGVLAGHDYHITIPGVVRAVDEFGERNNLKVFNLGEDWWFWK